MKFIGNLLDFAAHNPDKPALSNCIPGREITYGQLAERSGRVYRYLKERGIGKEDFVNILLPRGVETFIAMVGVWRAGAAFVVLEDGYPAERVDYIQKDCGCKLVLDYARWQEIQRCEPLPGFEAVDDHDAAFAVYTSGSTGNPKGVLHEYGNLDRIAVSLGFPFSRFGLIAPLNFVAALIAFEVVCRGGGVMFVIPYATLKNPGALPKCFVDNGITETFCAPSIYPLFRRIPSLRVLIVSSEPAYGIWSDDPGLAVHNVYGMSESGFLVACARLDQPNEVAPIGQPRFPLRITLRGEDGNPVADGEAGEFCYENPFVRGYINLPEETARTFVDGETHTHDLARRLPDGNYVILGRIDDMIKVNGNRVEPAEIEAAARRVTGMSQVIARGFVIDGVTYICLYYADEDELDVEATRLALQKELPYYMIPSQIIRLDKLPRTQSGKLSRKLLPKPALTADRGQYAAPENDVERALCDAMAEVLKLDRVSATDDFYHIGGSSITSIELIGKCALADLNVSQVFRGRTPRKIAALYLAERRSDDGVSLSKRNLAALKRAFPLTAEQRYMLDYLLYSPKSTMQNLYEFLRIDGEIDVDRFVEAVNATIQSHPALMTILEFNEDSELMQRYAPERFAPVAIERVSEASLEALKATLIQPFKLINRPQCRFRVFQTEDALYLYQDVNHLFTDGTSMEIINREIVERYLGEGDIAPSEPDNYYLMLSEREARHQSPLYAQDQAYFEKRYEGVKWSKRLSTEIDSRENVMGDMEQKLRIPQEQIDALTQNSGLGKSGIFIAAELLALAAFNQARDIMVTWIYNGRDDKRDQDTVGLLFRELPVGVRLDANTTLKALLSDVQEQIVQGVVHSGCPWVSISANPQRNDNTSLNYQDMVGMEKELPLEVESLELPEANAASPNALDIVIIDEGEDTIVAASYSESRFRKTDVSRFLQLNIDFFSAMLERREALDISLGELFGSLALDFPCP